MATAAAPFVTFAPNTTAPVVLPLSEGDQGTAETVNRMWALIQDGKRDPEVNRLALQIINAAHVRPFDFAGQRRAIFDWFRRSIRFVRDIAGAETLRTPRETLAVAAGDCDDMTMALAALMATTGNDVRIVTIGVIPPGPDGPAPFSHVYAEVFDGRQWIPIDPARPGAAWGRGPERYTRKRIWFSTGQFSDQPGTSGLGFFGAPSAIALQQRQNVFANRRGHGRRGLRGLGDDSSGIDWTGIAQAITAGGNAGANIIRSVNNPYYGSTIASLTPAEQAALLQQQTNPLYSLNTVPSWVWIGGALLLVVMVAKR